MRRQLCFLAVILCISFHAQTATAQEKGKMEVSYKGGMKNWERDVSNQLFKYIGEVPHDYLLFYEISLNKKGVRSVKELYSSPDKIANEVCKAIKDISTNWTSKLRRFTNIIIPVFLKKDLENVNMTFEALSFNSGSQGYPNFRALKRCFLTRPVVFISYAPVRKSQGRSTFFQNRHIKMVYFCFLV